MDWREGETLAFFLGKKKRKMRKEFQQDSKELERWEGGTSAGIFSWKRWINIGKGSACGIPVPGSVQGIPGCDTRSSGIRHSLDSVLDVFSNLSDPGMLEVSILGGIFQGSCSRGGIQLEFWESQDEFGV